MLSFELRLLKAFDVVPTSPHFAKILGTTVASLATFSVRAFEFFFHKFTTTWFAEAERPTVQAALSVATRFLGKWIS